MNRTVPRTNDDPVGQSLTAQYVPHPDVFDEMMETGGSIRPQWWTFLSELGRLPEPELLHQWETAQRLVQENGTTYNVYEEKDGGARPWRLDPIPFLIGAKEWQELEAGLIQRARLLNEIVKDIYGEQRLLSGDLLPAPLIFGNPNFLRPLHGVTPHNGVHLNFMAFDIARAADHRWWVLSDRTQAPSGAGYTLENRVVLARTMPDIFRDVQVHRLAEFFQALSDHLVLQTGKDDPLMVLMTPGPHNETYFEHAYLARYLGVPLVEGGDLTVRDDKVFLKTLNGLKHVDLIFRRVDGDFCDPLELRSDSLLGVAGLVAAVRAGNVVVANSLGSGVVECEALMSFMPGLCRSLLGEKLMVPSLATWWCGQEKERQFVLDNIDRLILKPTFASGSLVGGGPAMVFQGDGSDIDRHWLETHLGRRGYEYFGQESLTLSTAPVWFDGGLQPRPMVLRVYVCADGDGYKVMPGGLTRTTDGFDARAVSMQQGDASKDTWVLSETPVSTFTRLATPDQPVTLRRSGSDLPSRVADNLFWLGRYAERTENSVRLLRSMILRLAGEAGAGDEPQTLSRLMKILVELGYMNQRTARKSVAGGIRAVEREVAVLLFERGNPNGLLELLGNLQRTASMVRERLSLDSWRILNGLYQRANNHSTKVRLDVDDALALLNYILESLAAFSGMQMENMTRSLGWRLLDTGRRIERAAHMSKLIREMAIDGDPAADGSLDLMLELGDSSMTYRTRYLSTVQLPAVVDLLLTDETNPRSVAFQVEALAEHVASLPHNQEDATLEREQYLIVAMASQLRLADAQRLCGWRNKRGRRSELNDFVATLENQMFELADVIARKYFSHAMPTRSKSSGGIVP